MIYLAAGELALSQVGTGAHGDVTHLSAPGLICLPTGTGSELRLLAGSSGVLLAINETGMFAALGRGPESIEMRDMVGHLVSLSLTEAAEERDQIIHALNAIAWELDRTAAGQASMLSAHVRCLLVHLWRHGERNPEVMATRAPQDLLLRRFRQLVETRYRSRWRVSDYADALGVSADRLHNAATRALGRTPLALIHERALREAKALLSRSSLTLDQIAAHLGFATSAQFSAFFKKREGMPPGKYRNTRSRLDPKSGPEASFTDWP
jgi:AraC-like DNA-binding protein